MWRFGESTDQIILSLHKYLAEVAHVDIWWFIGSRLDQAPASLPELHEPLEGSSVVPWRYHFNTVTTSYTSAFWSWEDWEVQLDWMALRGVNLALAWIGIEKIFLDTFREIGLKDEEIFSFLSGPAFLAWNHFGNIQGSWGGDIPESWINDQFALQKKILKRMLELGMTPILPAFPGFVPEKITRVWPDVSVAKSSQWEEFPEKYTNVTYVTPYDPHFSQLQKIFIQKQQAAYGKITNFWTLDQFNENTPASTDLSYLKNVSHNTWSTLKAADPDAIWVMQGWLFASASTFWTNDRIKAFMDGVPVDTDMLLLDLFSESTPQWQRTNSFYGKPWIWCELHGYGGNNGLYGQIENVTVNAMEAVEESPTLIGFGLTMEGQEGNEIMYDLLLDQAWESCPIDTDYYFYDWVSSRYQADIGIKLPRSIYAAWDMVRSTVFNNTDSTVQSTTKSIFVLVPSNTGLVNRTGHHSTKITYDTDILVEAWNELYQAGNTDAALYNSPSYQYDLVDWTRQVLANSFQGAYLDLMAAYNASKPVQSYGNKLQEILISLDMILNTNTNFQLSTWTDAAKKTAKDAGADPKFFDYNARNQITLWGPTGQIEDYAAREWAGLVGGYYAQRWNLFVKYLEKTPVTKYNQTVFATELKAWEEKWVEETSSSGKTNTNAKSGANLKGALKQTVEKFPDLFKTA